MTIFVLFMVLFFVGGLVLHKQPMVRVYQFVAVMTLVMTFGYFFLDWI